MRHHPRRVGRLATFVVAAFACQEVEQPLGDGPSTGTGGAGAAGGAAVGSAGETVGGTGGDTGARAGAGGTHGGTNAAGNGGSATAGAGGGPPMAGGPGTGGGAGRGGSGNEPGDGGEPDGGDTEVRFVVIGPIDPESPTPRDGIGFYVDWVEADASGSVFAGFSGFTDPATDFASGARFLWTAEGGTVTLPYASPKVGMYAVAHLSRDGKSVFGPVMKVEQLENSTQYGPVAFYRWTADTGDVPFGPSEPMWNGQIDFVGADGNVALGLVELRADVEAGIGNARPFRWSESRGFELLSTLGWTEDADFTAVSDDGTVIAGTGENGQGFLWFDPDRVVRLTDLGGFQYCWVSSLSSDGTIAFGSCQNEEPAPEQAFRWTAETGMVAIDLPGGFLASEDGSVAIGTDGAALYRFSASDGAERLEPPAAWVAGSSYSIQVWRGALSRDGSTVWGKVSTNAASMAFRWSEATGFVRLDPLPDHDVADVHGQTFDGAVQVGLSKLGQSTIDATLWDCAGPRDIARELEDGGADLQGVHLGWASHVWADSTLMIAGSGAVPGGYRVAWIAWLPNRC
jgi:hypothetical protein